MPGLGIPFAIVAIVLGVRARRHVRTVGLPTSMATGAIVTGALAILIPLVFYVMLSFARFTDSSDIEPQGTPTPTSTTIGVGYLDDPAGHDSCRVRAVLVGRSGACRARQSRPVGPRRPGPHATPPLALRRCCPRGRRAARSSRG